MAGRNAGPGETSGTYGHGGQRRQTGEGVVRRIERDANGELNFRKQPL